MSLKNERKMKIHFKLSKIDFIIAKIYKKLGPAGSVLKRQIPNLKGILENLCIECGPTIGFYFSALFFHIG